MRQQLTEIALPATVARVREIRATRFEMRAQRVGLRHADPLHPAEHGAPAIPTSHAK